MPQALALIWHAAMRPGEAAVALGIGLMALSVEGWATGLTILSTAVAYALIRTAPAMAKTIREIGGAWVDVRIKYRRELEAIKAGMVEIRREAIEKAEAVERDSSKKRHDLADKVYTQLLGTHVEIDSLKQKLGQTDVRDVHAINTVSDSVQIIAEKARVPLPAPLPHLDPLPPNGGGHPGDKP